MSSEIAVDTPNSRLSRALKSAASVPTVWALIALIIATGFLYQNFWTLPNINNLLLQNAPLALVAIGMTYVIISGGFDLSVGAIFAGGAIFYASFDGVLPMPLALLLSVLFGVLSGLLNGVLVARFKINAFVATLGTASIIYGVVNLYVPGAIMLSSPEYQILNGRWFGIPIAVWITAAIFIIAGLVLARTTFGRSIYTTGGNFEAARLNGVRVRFVVAMSFVIVGALSAFAGVLLVSEIGTAQPNYGANMPLDAIAAVIIGGTVLMGGEGAIWRTLVGVMILAVINNLFSALTLEPAFQGIIKGAIVVVAVGFDRWSRARRSS